MQKVNSVKHTLLLFVLLLSTSFALVAQPAPIIERRIALTLLNLSNDPQYGLNWMRTMRIAGCNTVIIPVAWERIYPKADSKPDWRQIDNQMKLAEELGMKVGIRIYIGRHVASIDGLWSHKESMHDFKGFESTFYYANTHPSFAAENAFVSTAKFITEVCERYKSYQTKGQVLFVNIANTPDQEAGFYYRNQQWPEEGYDAIYDHSDASMGDMRKRLEAKYKTVNTLNRYWGTKFLEFKKVDPPANIYNIQANFRGKMGKDWWAIRHFQLKEYLEKLNVVIKTVDPTYKVCYDFGSMTDKQSLLRGTYAVKSLTEKADFVKHNDEDRDWSFDIIRNNIKKPIFNEVYHFHKYTVDDLVSLMNWYFEEGSSMVCVVVATEDTDRDITMARQAVERIVGWYDKPINQEIKTNETMDLYLSQLIDNYDDRLSRWRYLAEKGKRVKINLIEDILQEEKIDYLPYKTPEELAIEYGYYFPPTNGGGSGGGGVVNPPPVDTTDKINKPPFSQRKFTPEPIIVKQPFYFWLDSDIFIDNDGYISTIEMLKGPEWLTFRRDGFFFQGIPPKTGTFDVTLKAYDNKGLSAIDSFTIQVIPPVINLQAIEADYFDIPIRYLGPISAEKEFYLEDLPEQINILADCNVDSISVQFELKGPYFHQSTSERRPFSVFGEGRGFTPPIGKYSLVSKAIKGDSVVTQKEVSFIIKDKRNSTPLEDWVSFPNPFKDVTNLKVPITEPIDQLTFQLKDVLGHNYVISKDMITVFDRFISIDIRKFQLQHSTYFLEIIKGNSVIEVKRIVKQ